MTAVIVFVVMVFVVPMLLAEFTDWLPWVATRLILRAANRLPAERRGRYAEEWAAEFSALPGGKLNKLRFGLQITPVRALPQKCSAKNWRRRRNSHG